MTDYNNAKIYDYDRKDMHEFDKIRNKIQDPKWKYQGLNKPKPK